MTRKIILIFLVVACLIGGAAVLPHVDAIRIDLGSKSFAGLPAQAPPDIILLTHVLGGFRGLIVDAVWLRATRLQYEKKFWELYQLYDWMGKLEPRIEAIWDHIGWNMAYNLVAELQDSEARWQWIQRAIELMRDQGLKYNPRSGKIMERIAWTYYHKIGRDTDYHHYYYKRRLAEEMHLIFLGRDQQDLQAMAQAPRELKDLLAEPDIAAALSGFQLNPPEEDVKKLAEINTLAEIPPRLEQVIRTAPQDVKEKIQYYLTARIVREHLKMGRIDIMLAMESNWGKLDWRLPEPHAIYWSWLAAEVDPTPQRQISYDRLVLFSLQELWRRGIISYIPSNRNDPMITTFDLGKVQAINEQYARMFVKYSIEGGDYGAESLRDGHMQFVTEAAFNLYFAGYEQEAAKYHEILYRLYGKPEPFIPVGDYVLGRVQKMVEEFGTQAKIRMFVDDLIYQTCFFYATNNLNEARKYESLARRSWDCYREFTEYQTDRPEQAGVTPWKDVLRESVFNILAGRTPFPEDLRGTLRRILNIPEGAESQELKLEDIMIPTIPPSSPPPK